MLNITISLSFFKEVGFIIIPISTSISTWAGVLVYIYFLSKFKYLILQNNIYKNVFKIIVSTALMSFVLFQGLEYFGEKLIYVNKLKAIYLLFIVSFVATIYLITCYLLGILKIKNYKIN